MSLARIFTAMRLPQLGLRTAFFNSKRVLRGRLFPANTFCTEQSQHIRVFMPKTSQTSSEELEAIFDVARRSAAEPHDRKCVIVMPDRALYFANCPPAGTVPAEIVDEIEMTLPSSPKQNVVGIVFTDPEALQSNFIEAIPFLDKLLGMAYIGHTVWAFEGAQDALSIGCRGANLVIADSEVVKFLCPDWVQRVKLHMQQDGQVYVHERDAYALRRLA